MRKEDFEQLEAQRHRNKLDEIEKRQNYIIFNSRVREWENLSEEEKYERNLAANRNNLLFHSVINFISLLVIIYSVYKGTKSFIDVGILSFVSLSLFIYLTVSGRAKIIRAINYFVGISFLLFLSGKVFNVNISTYYVITSEIFVFLLVLAIEYGDGFDKDAAPKFRYTSPEKVIFVCAAILMGMLALNSNNHNKNTDSKSSKTSANNNSENSKKINEIFGNNNGAISNTDKYIEQKSKINNIYSINSTRNDENENHANKNITTNSSSSHTNSDSSGVEKNKEDIKNIFSVTSN
jgi:hypothetical protein